MQIGIIASGDLIHKIAKLLILLGNEVLIPITGVVLILAVLLISDQIVYITHRLHLLHVLLLDLPVYQDHDRFLHAAHLSYIAVVPHLDLRVALGDVFELVDVGIDAGLVLVAVEDELAAVVGGLRVSVFWDVVEEGYEFLPLVGLQLVVL